MKLKELFDYVKVNNIDLNTEIGYIDYDNYYGSAHKITILTNGLGREMLCLDATNDVNLDCDSHCAGCSEMYTCHDLG